MAWFFEEFLDSVDDALKVLEKGIKTYTKLQELVKVDPDHPSGRREKTVIAATDDIKMKDVTPGDSPRGTRGNSARKAQIIETEMDSTGRYVPIQTKLPPK